MVFMTKSGQKEQEKLSALGGFLRGAFFGLEGDPPMLNNLQPRTVLLEMKSSILETLLGGTWRRFRVSSECLSILMLMGFGASSTPPLISNQTSLVNFGSLHRVPSLLTWGGHLNQCRVVAGFSLSFIDIRSPLCPVTRFPIGMYSSGLSICKIYDMICWELASPIGCP